jgi:hypothetical protein
MVGGGRRLADAVAATADRVCQGAQHGVELGRLDLVQHVDEVLEDGIDFGADIA